MSSTRGIRSGALRMAAVLAVCAGGAAALPGMAAAVTCSPLATFDPANFHNPTRIDNPLLPITPGTHIRLEGRANRGGGPLPHTVDFHVTDLTKIVAGIPTVVVWDVDINEGVVAESELAFFAQDDAGNVWSLGEYPEEFLTGTFVGAPSTWVSGLRGAEGGILVPGTPTKSSSFFIEGVAPDIGFFDCGRVKATGRRITSGTATYDNGAIIEELDPGDLASGRQLKYYAPGAGNVKIEPVNDPEGETLVQVERGPMAPDVLAAARNEALGLDARAFQNSGVWGLTLPIVNPFAPKPAPAPAPTNQVKTVTVTSPAALTARAARGAVRRVVLDRLKGWTITDVTCKAKNGGMTCKVSARRRGGLRLSGSGTVTRRSSGSLRTRLTVKITKRGCHPVASKRCTRKALWAA